MKTHLLKMVKTLSACLVSLTLLCSGVVLQAAEQVNIYSYRQPFLIKPVVKDFTEKTGIKVNILFAKKGLTERLKREGKHSQADLVLTSDIRRLMELTDKGLTQAVVSSKINSNIPAHLRDIENHWFALTTRVRNIYASKQRIGKVAISYEDLASKKYQGKICTRSGKHAYSVALVSSMIDHHGLVGAKTWLQGLNSNLARKPQGNVRGQVKAIKEGICDIALGNSYYFGKMLSDKNQLAFSNSVYLLFPNQADRGAHSVSLSLHARRAPAAAAA